MLVTIGIPLLAILVAANIVWFLYRTRLPKPATKSAKADGPSWGVLAATIAFVMADQMFLAYAGVLQSWDAPPPLMLMIFVSLGATVVLALTGPGGRIAQSIPFAALIGYQAFRLPLELIMHQASNIGLMPEQMSYSGYNFDIVTGTLAIPVALLASTGKAPRWMLLAWNALGSVLLLVVMGIAIASTPTFAAFGPDALNTWVADIPYVWLPGVLVPAALFGHLVVWRKLFPQAEPEQKPRKHFKRQRG